MIAFYAALPVFIAFGVGLGLMAWGANIRAFALAITCTLIGCAIAYAMERHHVEKRHAPQPQLIAREVR